MFGISCPVIGWQRSGDVNTGLWLAVVMINVLVDYCVVVVNWTKILQGLYCVHCNCMGSGYNFKGKWFIRLDIISCNYYFKQHNKKHYIVLRWCFRGCPHYAWWRRASRRGPWGVVCLDKWAMRRDYSRLQA